MIRRVAALLGLTALAGCNLEPHYVRPVAAVAPGWPAGDAYLRASEASLPAVDYRTIFRDPALQRIIAQALANNQDLRVALANIAAARATLRVERAALLPEIDANARYVRSNGNATTGTGSIRTGTGGTGTGTGGGIGTGTGGTGTGTGTGGTGTGGTGTGGTGTGGTGTIVSSGSSGSSFDLNLGITAFEIDLFGRVRSLTRAAQQELLGTEAAARTARLSLVAEVATAYLTLATDRSLVAIAADTEASAQRSVDLTQARLTGGIAPRTDLRQAETVRDQARADRADATTLVAQDRNALELLVGATVADTDLPRSIEAVDTLLGELPAGLDSRVLLRRPDVVDAEYSLRAANARIGAARASFFPTISLTALAGVASTGLTSLFSGGAFSWSVQPQATLPLFDWGTNRGNLDYARAQADLAVANYQKTIQTAFSEVADALARRGTIDRQFAALSHLEEAARDSNFLALARYREGIDPYLNTLDSQRTLYSARRSVASVRLVRADNLVTLYRTLGGDQRYDSEVVP